MSEVYLMTLGKFSCICSSEDIAKSAAKKIAVDNNIAGEAAITKYYVNSDLQMSLNYYEAIDGLVK